VRHHMVTYKHNTLISTIPFHCKRAVKAWLDLHQGMRGEYPCAALSGIAPPTQVLNRV
jgi:hypothetical protein